MKTINYKFAVILLVLGALSFSCGDDFLDRYPLDTPSPQVFFVNEESAKQAVAAAYYPIVRGSFAMYRRDLTNLFDAMTDDAHWRPAIANAISQAAWNIDPSSQYIGVYWKSLYQSINAANFAIEQIPSLINYGVPQEKIDQYVAEAHFVRGWCYLFLVNFYGDVPLNTSTLSDFEEFSQPRAATEKVFDQIIHDFTFARDKLPTSWPSSLRGSATKAAGAAYLAKAYLYRRDYPAAEAAARDAIQIAEGSGYYLVEDYMSIFDVKNEGNPEILFYWNFVEEPSGQSTNATVNRIARTPPQFNDVFGAAGRAYHLPQRDLYDAFEEGDPRRGYSIFAPGDDYGIYQREEPFKYTHSTFNENGEQVQYTVTYKAGDTIKYDYRWSETGMNTRKLIYNIAHLGSVTQAGMDEPQMRMAELYLILAEALAEQGKAEALNWVNKVRARPSVNMPPKTTADGDLVALVRHERRVELSGEGHRLWDLIRWRELKNVFGNGPKVKRHFFSDYLPADDLNSRFDTPSLDKYPTNEILFPIPLDHV